MAFEGQDEFYIAKFLVSTGSEVPVGSPILISVEDESSVAAFADYKAPTAASSPTPTVASAIPAPTSIPTSVPVKSAATPPPPATPPPAPVTKAQPPAPVTPTSAADISPSPAATSASSSNDMTGMYSIRIKSTSGNSSPLSSKLKKDQQTYNLKYGRTVNSSSDDKKKDSKK